MSIIKNVVVEAMATHPGFLKLSLVNHDGTLACETLMNIGTAQRLIADLNESNRIAKGLLENLQSIITKESLNGSFGDGMKDWAQKGGYEYNARLEQESKNV